MSLAVANLSWGEGVKNSHSVRTTVLEFGSSDLDWLKPVEDLNLASICVGHFVLSPMETVTPMFAVWRRATENRE